MKDATLLRQAQQAKRIRDGAARILEADVTDVSPLTVSYDNGETSQPAQSLVDVIEGDRVYVAKWGRATGLIIGVKRDTSWHNVSFGSGWSNVGSGFQTCQYRRRADGIVEVRGSVQRTSGSNTTVFTLPTGYRPAVDNVAVGYDNGGATLIVVNDTGAVSAATYAGGALHLGLIAFPAEG